MLLRTATSSPLARVSLHIAPRGLAGRLRAKSTTTQSVPGTEAETGVNPQPLFTVIPLKTGQERYWSEIERYGVKRMGDGGKDPPVPELPTPVLKRMSNSYCQFILPFKSRPTLLNEYVNVHGLIRVGRILEELDKLAGAVAYRHCSVDNQVGPVTIVTAAVDRIELLNRLSAHEDYKFSGKVCHVGSSSMEIYLKVETLQDGSTTEPKEIVLAAHFTMVARHQITQKAIRVNPLKIITEKEKAIYALSLELKERKKQRSQSSLLKEPPTAEERRLMHQLYLESMEYTDHKFEPERKPANVVWSDETKLQSITVTMPADRNIHNKIFGGYLMRLALELAYAEAQLFTRRIPQVWAIDDISFRKPVPIGCLLELTAQVTFSPGTDGGTFEVAVEIEVIDPETRAKETANVFNITFKSPEGVAAPRIIPRTYADLIKYVEANRRYEQHKNRFTLPREFIDD